MLLKPKTIFYYAKELRNNHLATITTKAELIIWNLKTSKIASEVLLPKQVEEVKCFIYQFNHCDNLAIIVSNIIFIYDFNESKMIEINNLIFWVHCFLLPNDQLLVLSFLNHITKITLNKDKYTTDQELFFYPKSILKLSSGQFVIQTSDSLELWDELFKQKVHSVGLTLEKAQIWEIKPTQVGIYDLEKKGYIYDITTCLLSEEKRIVNNYLVFSKHKSLKNYFCFENGIILLDLESQQIAKIMPQNKIYTINQDEIIEKGTETIRIFDL